MLIYVLISIVSLIFGWFAGCLMSAPDGFEDTDGFHYGSEYQQNRIKGLEDALWQKERDLNVAEIQIQKLKRVVNLKNIVINKYVEERANLLDTIKLLENKEAV